MTVLQFHVERVLLDGPPPDVFDVYGKVWVDLISIDPDEGYQAVGLSFLFPRAYSLLEIALRYNSGVIYTNVRFLLC